MTEDEPLCRHGRPINQDCFACEAGAMEAYSREAENERREEEAELARMDEQEAASLKYSRSLSILALASGKFALFFPWSNDGGMPLAKIADWADLESEVRAWRDKAEPQPIAQRRTLDAINLDELFSKENTCGN